MTKKNYLFFKDVDLKEIKKLSLFESVYTDFDTKLGFSACYTRVYGGLIRTIMTPEAISQQFISVPESFF